MNNCIKCSDRIWFQHSSKDPRICDSCSLKKSSILKLAKFEETFPQYLLKVIVQLNSSEEYYIIRELENKKLLPSFIEGFYYRHEDFESDKEFLRRHLQNLAEQKLIMYNAGIYIVLDKGRNLLFDNDLKKKKENDIKKRNPIEANFVEITVELSTTNSKGESKISVINTKIDGVSINTSDFIHFAKEQFSLQTGVNIRKVKAEVIHKI
ncbi:hypothetical protein RKD55_004720 [Rossellomorea marisflavi]